MGKFLWVKFMKSLTQIDLVYVNYLKKDSINQYVIQESI